MVDKKKTFANILYVGETRANFIPGKLPTNSDVMKVFFHHHRDLGMVIRKSSSATADLALSHCSQMTSSPLILKQNAIKNIERLFKVWKDLQKGNKKKISNIQQQRERDFAEKLKNLFEMRKSTLPTEYKKSHHKSPKEKCPSSAVSPAANSTACGEEISIRAAKCQAVLLTKQYIKSQESDDLDVNLNTRSSADDSDEDYICEPDQPEIKKPRKEVMTPMMTQTLDCLGVSARGAPQLLTNLIKDIGEDPGDYKLSQGTIQKKRQVNRRQIVEEIKESFTPDRRLCLHWDGKMIRGLVGSGLVDRIAIVVTGVTTEKILEIPPLSSSGTAETTAELVFGVVKQWDVAEQVKALSFDTTAVNSGHKNGVCIRLQRLFGRELLLLACRHHIMEIFLEALFVVHLGSSTGPEILLFKRFQEQWPKIDQRLISRA